MRPKLGMPNCAALSCTRLCHQRALDVFHLTFYTSIVQLVEHHPVSLVVEVSGSSPLWGSKMPYDGIGKWMITYILLFGCHTLLNYRSCRFVVESFVTL